MTLVYVCTRCGAQAATRYVRGSDERSVSTCCGEPVTLDILRAEPLVPNIPPAPAVGTAAG